MIHRRRLLAAAAAIAAVAAVVSYASAAALSVSAAKLTSVTVGNPCTGTATTGNPVGGSTATTVNVTLPPGCVVTSRTVQVTVVDSGGAHSSASVVMSGSTQAFTVSPAYTASATVTPSVTVDGWSFLTTWTYTPPPIEPGNPQTVIQSITWSISNQNQACATVTVTTNTAQSNWWLVNLNVAQPPFYGATSGYQITDGQVEFVPSSDTAVGGVLGIQGRNNGWGNLRQGATRTFTVCH